MTDLIKKVHVYLGLISFSALIVYGLAGLVATFATEGEQIPASTRFEAYEAPAGSSDREIVDAVYRKLAVPLAGPVPAFAIRRDGNNDLTFIMYTLNGPTRVTVLEKESRLRVEATRVGVGHYFVNLHTVASQTDVTDWRVRLWAIYNEIAIWSLCLMVLSGVYLGLVSRPRFRWGKYALGIGSVAFIALYVVNR